MRRIVEREQEKKRRFGEEKRDQDKVHLRESMVEAVKSKRDEKGYDNLQTRMSDREKTYEDYGCKCVE